MRIARVVGSAVSTVKEKSLVGHKLLLVREADECNEMTGPVFVAVDVVGDVKRLERAPDCRLVVSPEMSPVNRLPSR